MVKERTFREVYKSAAKQQFDSGEEAESALAFEFADMTRHRDGVFGADPVKPRRLLGTAVDIGDCSLFLTTTIYSTL